MKIIWTFTLMMIPGVVSSMSVIGYSGGGVNITCKYDKGYTENKKYFCRGKMPKKIKSGWCSDLIRTNETDKWIQKERFSLYDDTRSPVFTVTIRNLTEEDSGTYQCGVDLTTGKDSYTEVKLNILTETNPHRTTSSYTAPAITSASPATGGVALTARHPKDLKSHQETMKRFPALVVITRRVKNYPQAPLISI
ncbi:polymeric immunoglobulin receptor-like [Pimephales promelas]|nr:polymeric immunoglobulin receptor-like [Pimephales promelas]